MARMRPELNEDQLRELRSRAEAQVYCALRDQLTPDILVIHSLCWVYRDSTGRVREGEADFTVFIPATGFLTLEVKGGGVDHDGITGEWTSLDRNGNTHPIKDPFEQAKKERFAVRDQLQGHVEWRKWSGRRLLCGHAVVFPDLTNVASLVGPSRPRALIGSHNDLDHLSTWITNAVRFWSANGPTDPLTSHGVQLAERILCASISVRPPLAIDLELEDAVRLRLTEQQARILRILGGRNRAIIGGGAGTGKTLIAVEKAKRTAGAGRKTLLVCYNRRLADALRLAHKDCASLEIMSYHQLCDHRISRVHQLTGRDVLSESQRAYPGEDLYDTQLPFALALANDDLPEKYDAVIVDEAQDFREDYWLGIQSLLEDPDNGTLYLFFDPNQILYRRCGKLPLNGEPHWLTLNCRNTSFIHEAAYRYYTGEQIDPPEIKGAPLTEIVHESAELQAAAIAKEITRLLNPENMRPQDIAVLLIGRPKQSYYDLLTKQRLPNGLTWGVEQDNPKAVLVDTVARYKGLEAAVVFLWLSPIIDGDEDREALYVGLSRSKSRLYLIGNQSACSAVLPRPA